MGFHLCPLKAQVQRLFKNEPERLRLPRQPISERAAQARRLRHISPEAALGHVAQAEFSLSGNHFRIENKLAIERPDLISLAISHFGSIARQVDLELKFISEGSDEPMVIASLFDQAGSQARTAWSRLVLTRIEFQIIPLDNRLLLYNIQGSGEKLAGAALIALYNIARDLGLEQINFFIKRGNVNAKQFYFHMDFGKPEHGRDWSWWGLRPN
ncbi:MAG: hypothetical protein JW782_05880 [Candidatus Saganbacteria bacterium]|nr:hypothetical protein [Candidatus Saganbacteria bacterium]